MDDPTRHAAIILMKAKAEEIEKRSKNTPQGENKVIEGELAILFLAMALLLEDFTHLESRLDTHIELHRSAVPKVTQQGSAFQE